MWQWLRRNFLTGVVVMVPGVVSVVAIVWLFRLVDRLTRGLSLALFGRSEPLWGILVTGALVLGTGILATNVLGRRLLARGEALLLHVPLFRTIYGPVKQLVVAFAPDNEVGFKRVVLVDRGEGFVLGFVTREFTVEREGRTEALLAVYVPTNHLYLGNIAVCRPADVTYPDVTVEQGVQIFLTGGMAIPGAMTAHPGHELPMGGGAARPPHG